MNDPRHPAQPHSIPPHPAPGVPPRPVAPAQAIPRPAPAPRPAAAPSHAVPHAQPHAHPPAQPHAQTYVGPASQNIPRPGGGSTINPAVHVPKPQEEDAIALVEEDDNDETAAGAVAAPSKIRFGADIVHKKHEWKRQLKEGGAGACRVRTFHGKLSDQGLEYIDDAINVWLDDHPEIDIKFVTTNVGLFDGKFKDLALIVNVWY
jgi:hypothetical protein